MMSNVDAPFTYSYFYPVGGGPSTFDFTTPGNKLIEFRLRSDGNETVWRIRRFRKDDGNFEVAERPTFRVAAKTNRELRVSPTGQVSNVVTDWLAEDLTPFEAELAASELEEILALIENEMLDIHVREMIENEGLQFSYFREGSSYDW